MTEPVSPCVSICQLNPTTRICTGCYRTIDEIAAWGQLDAQGRRRILANVSRRRAAGPDADIQAGTASRTKTPGSRS